MRLDHLLSKECCQLSMLTTTQLNTGYSGALVYRQMIGRLRTRCLHSRSEPAIHGPVPTGSTGLSLFRFEGATLCGSVPVTSPLRHPACTFESSPSGAPRARASFLLSCPRVRVPAVTTHPVRAPVGWLSRCAAVLVQRGSRPRRALCSPLRIPKRARASLFSKLQRANGECLGA